MAVHIAVAEPPFRSMEVNTGREKTVTVMYETVDQTATAASGDYVATSPTLLTFPPGETTGAIEMRSARSCQSSLPGGQAV